MQGHVDWPYIPSTGYAMEMGYKNCDKANDYPVGSLHTYATVLREMHSCFHAPLAELLVQITGLRPPR